jgi:hypothetical protein
MKKILGLLTDPYIIVPALIGGAVGHYTKGKEADGAGRYAWPAGGVAAGVGVGYLIRSKIDAATAASAPQVAQNAPTPSQTRVSAPPAQDGYEDETVMLNEYVPEMDYDGDGDVDIDDMFSDSEAEEFDYPAATPSAGYRGPQPADEAEATASEEHAYALADEYAQEMGHGSLGNSNGTSDTDLAEGWGGFGEPSLDGDVSADDLASGIPGMRRNSNGVN